VIARVHVADRIRLTSYSTQIGLRISRRMLIAAVTAARVSYQLAPRDSAPTGAPPGVDGNDQTRQVPCMHTNRGW
jgi:hypothetical protein